MLKHNLKIDWATYEAAKYACENWHYSKCLPVGKLVKVGVWENGQFIGVVLFGRGANNNLLRPYGLKQNEGCELVRVALSNHKTPVSRIVSIALNFLKKSNTNLCLVVSFADTEQNHIGGIYQAGNWIYSGKSNQADEYIFNGKRYQGRAFRNIYKGMEKNPLVKIIKGSEKHRYLYPLDNAMKKKILPLSKPYPKRVQHDSHAIGDQPIEGGAIPTHTLQSSGVFA